MGPLELCWLWKIGVKISACKARTALATCFTSVTSENHCYFDNLKISSHDFLRVSLCSLGCVGLLSFFNNCNYLEILYKHPFYVPFTGSMNLNGYTGMLLMD